MFHAGGFWFLLAFSVIVYWMLPRVWRNGALTAFSFAYLLTLDSRGPLLALLLGIGFYFLLPRRQSRFPAARSVAACLILVALGILAYVKYVPAMLATWNATTVSVAALPLGISYFTFKLIHYAVETRRGTLPSHGFGDFLGYLLLFPTFSMGPIERFEHFMKHRELGWQSGHAVEGIARIFHGLIKRFALVDVVLPTVLGPLPTVGRFLADLDHVAPWEVWWFLARTYLYAYLEFSGYTDMAIGASRLFGIRIMENFNYPILATNISEFWQRWHMTLTGWCQSYVYMPLIGLTRSPYVATYGAFVAMGLWHAGTLQWLAWGLYHATGIACYVTWRRWSPRRRASRPKSGVKKVLAWAATQSFVVVGYSLTCTFPHYTFLDSMRILLRLFGLTFAPSGS